MTNSVQNIIVVGPALKMGGMERATANIANGFAEQGYSVTLITIFDQAIFFQLHESIRLVTPVGFNKTHLNFIKTLLYLRKSIINTQPDVVVAYNKFYSAITLLALFFDRKIAVFISERSSPLYQWSLMVRTVNWLAFKLRAPQGVIAQTKVAAQHQARYYGARIPIKVIPNILRHVKKYPEVKRDKFILAVGRLNDPLKGFDRLLQAYSLVKHAGWRLQIAGGESDQDAVLNALIVKLNLQSSIDFLGKVEEVDACFARASIFVIPSRSEGFPNALCEAMSAGLACISFDFVAGPNEMIRHQENGWLVPDGDIQALADAISVIMENEVLRLKLGAEAVLISKQLSSPKIVMEHISFFNDARTK